MDSLWFLIPLLTVLILARLWLGPAKRPVKLAEPAESLPDAAPEPVGAVIRVFRAMMDTVVLWTFSLSLIFSLGFTLFLFGAQGEGVETGILLAALAYCMSLITFRGWQPPKIVAGGWAGNARNELRCLRLAYAIILLPLACIGGVKLIMHSNSINFRATIIDLAVIFVMFGVVWLIRFLPLPDEKLTIENSDQQ